MKSNDHSLCGKLRILAVLPIPYGDDPGFWYRDMGLIVRALRSLGHDAWLVALKGPSHVPSKDKPVIVAAKEELEDPAWWKKQAPYGVIVNFWGAAKWEGIREAVRQATPRLVEKLDTDGFFSPRIWFWRYSYESFFCELDAGHSVFLSLLTTLIRSCIVGSFPGLLDRKRVVCLSKIPRIAAESPIAAERTRRYIRTFGQYESKVVCIPHPVDMADFQAPGDCQRENKIVAVGRWGTYQKNFPLLLKVMHRFLKTHPDWSANILGGLPVNAEKQWKRIPTEISSRIKLAGKVDHPTLAKYYLTSKIFFMPSRYESFNIAAAEALCCGCSVVGSGAIPSVPFFCSSNSGTPSSDYTANNLLDALNAEADEWGSGRRDPDAISSAFIRELSAEGVAGRYLQLFAEMGESSAKATGNPEK
jgi:glycosyltransferase involved in cell wall biosynthesis